MEGRRGEISLCEEEGVWVGGGEILHGLYWAKCLDIVIA